ncbi:hypothetical protein [Pantoea ananatis]|uniref:hypothetical protein n=1 Tax=Pantoea ananas TaxID=553 RepID=UPI001B30877E|nr:hypothetical protein [Pantoea ananatis]
MKTNSPNPVDGDVQALIADCEAEIVELEKRLTTWGEVWIPYLQSKLRRQQIALAALTAKPVAFLYGASFERGEVEGEIEDCPGTDMPVFTTPPAQLLRPVELKDCEFGAVSIMSGGSKDYCNGFVDGTNNAIKAIREAGYEVKS